MNLNTCVFSKQNLSNYLYKEWTAADAMGKPILPIFLKADHIPPLLRSRLGVEFDKFDFKKNITALYELIIKKSQS